PLVEARYRRLVSSKRSPFARCTTALLIGSAMATSACYSGLDDPFGGADLEPKTRIYITDVAVSLDRIQFQADDETIDIELVPNTELLAPDAVVIRDGSHLRPEQA